MSIFHPFYTEQPNQPKLLSVGPRLQSLVALRALRALSVTPLWAFTTARVKPEVNISLNVPEKPYTASGIV